MTLFGIQVERSEWRFVGLWAGLMALLSLLPHIIAYITTPPGSTYAFTGYAIYHDVNTYFTWIRQAAEGHVLFEFQYSFESHIRALFQPVFFLMGLLVRVGTPLAIVWFTVQALSVIGLVLTLYLFISRFFSTRNSRRFALRLTTCAGGFGFLGYLFSRWPSPMRIPTDVSMPETTLGGSMLWPFIFCIAISLMLLSMLMFLRYLDTGTKRILYGAAGVGLLMNLVHPYDAVTLLVVITTYTLVVRGVRALIPLMIYCAIVSIPTIYHLMLLADPVFKGHSEFLQLSPYPLAYLLGFGVVLPFACAGIISLVRDRRWEKIPHVWFLVIWMTVVPLLVYIPFSFQRRLIEGAVIPITLLAVMGLTFFWGRVKISSGNAHTVFPRGAMALLWTILPLSFVCMVWIQIDKIRAGGFPYYLSSKQTESFEWLRLHVHPEDRILASGEIGNFVPRFTSAHVYFGHGAQSIDGEKKYMEVRDFYSTTTSMKDREYFALQHGIDYVLFGQQERELGEVDFSTSTVFTPVFANGEVSIYRVVGLR